MKTIKIDWQSVEDAIQNPNPDIKKKAELEIKKLHKYLSANRQKRGNYELY